MHARDCLDILFDEARGSARLTRPEGASNSVTWNCRSPCTILRRTPITLRTGHGTSPRSHTGSRPRRLQPQMSEDEEGHACRIAALPLRTDRSRHRQASRTHLQAPRRRPACRSSQAWWKPCSAPPECQQALASAANGDSAASNRMAFRIGVHLGDVIVAGRRCSWRWRQYRDAPRKSLPSRAAFVISRQVYDQVQSKVALDYRSLGPAAAQEHSRRNRSLQHWRRHAPPRSTIGRRSGTAARLTA